VARSYQAVTGQRLKAIGAVLPYSYTANDTCHLWKAGIPCLLYGPGVSRGSADEDDSCVLISDMVKVTQVLALTAVEVCNRERPAASSYSAGHVVRIGSFPSQVRAASAICAKIRSLAPLKSKSSTTVPGCVSVSK
jgi:hypothetical protein